MAEAVLHLQLPSGHVQATLSKYHPQTKACGSFHLPDIQWTSKFKVGRGFSSPSQAMEEMMEWSMKIRLLNIRSYDQIVYKGCVGWWGPNSPFSKRKELNEPFPN